MAAPVIAGSRAWTLLDHVALSWLAARIRLRLRRGRGPLRPDLGEASKGFNKASWWDRRLIIEKGGWATVPGTDTPNSAVATACAERHGRRL
jgi:hypothetical protein